MDVTLPGIGVAYCATNSVTGKKYIGITTGTARKRWNSHVGDALRGHRNGYFQNAIRKYGRDSFHVEPIACARSWDDLCATERLLIEQHDTMRPLGYNLTEGGEGLHGYKFDRAVVEAIAKKHRGNRHTEEAKARIAAAGRGRKHGNAARSAIGDSHRGKTLTAEHRAKLSSAKQGKKLPPRSYEHSRRISDGLRRAWARRKQVDG